MKESVMFMHKLFERVPFDKSAIIWKYRSASTADFPGFYHWHQCCEILFVHEGSGSVIVNRKMYPIRPGMLFFFQPFQLHKVHADVSPESPYVRSGIHFDPYEYEQALKPFTEKYKWFLELWQGNELEPAMDAAAEIQYLEQVLAMQQKSLLDAGGSRARSEDSCLLLLQLLHGISLIGRRDMAVRALRPRKLTYAEQMMQWVDGHYSQPVKLDDIAEALHLSKFHLSRLFQRETGSSLLQYLTARRIKTACRLLQTTSLSVEQIGERVGIPNPSYFIRLFKKEVGTTPLKYRQERY
ncbi:AraC family transcriptional regulator [Paenibacillus oralis]|uniref:AraC family transcriptional regulator n=1 Tax=Paenibacillus oralis TaxID=2490856 RepID=A0A3P3U4G9_9BACL|nr:AraC family transcriptional regulator [Paenibacillus oralis]RRJ64549.1 AraC family transcriptional regulator [Paenibacillus oralis]